MTTVDITPSPRVLRMLGQIDFAPWQCLAELIDNSIDAFIEQASSGTPAVEPRIYVQLPTESDLKASSGEIVIKDTASGMAVEQMKDAVRAGYSGNDPVEKMGLFGMGFNISTARMGRRTEVWTTRAEDAEWTGLVIDFGELEKSKQFNAPMVTKPKSDAELEARTHGTEIRISQLEADRVRPLIKGAGKRKTRDRLGKIYGRVMTRVGIEINYDGDVITPHQHCVWDASRSVDTQSFGMVPARLVIDKALDPRKFCTTCWVWLHEDESTCSACGESDHVIERQRRMKGWIGIQRYFDKTRFGIDLVRNGRVIEELDKSLFEFVDENGDSIFEYPIDATHWGGRIVGELEIDFVRVSHQKDAFDKLDPEWKRVVEIVRGTSPLQPKIAERMGLGRNDSPLAKLFTGYRKGTAGLKDLVPGTPEGQGLNSGVVKEYVDRFYAGDPAYQSDEKWYELVLQVERGKRGASKGAEEAAGEFPILPLDPEPDGDPKGEEAAPSGATETPAIDVPEKDESLSKTYKVDGLPGDISIKVTAFRHKHDINGRPFVIKPEGYVFGFDYNYRSSLFEEGTEGPLDFLMIDLAQHFLSVSAGSIREFPVSRVAKALRDAYFPATSGSLQAASESSAALLSELRRHFDEHLHSVAQADPIDPSSIDGAQLQQIQRTAVTAEGLTPADVDLMVREGRFARFVSIPYVVELTRRWPGLVTDGQFFTTRWADLPEDLRRLTVGEVVDSLNDVVWLSDEGASAINKDTGWRLRYSKALSSLKLLQFWRA